MRLRRKRLGVILLALVATLVLVAVLAYVGRPSLSCPEGDGLGQAPWSSRYVPLYSIQCPDYYLCPVPPGTGMQVRRDGTPVEIRINSQCARGQVIKADQDAPRIVFLGDSFGFGWAVAEEESYPFLVSEELGIRLGCPVEYVNLAIPGFSLKDKLESLRQKGLVYGPDVVVLQIFWDDWYGNAESQSYVPLLSWLARAVGRMGCARCEAWKMRIVSLNQQLFLRVHSEYSGRVQEEMKLIWREFFALSEQEGFTLVVLDLGSRPILSAVPEEYLPQVDWRLIPNFPEWESQENLLPDDGHPNPAGHRLLADALSDELLESGTLDCQPLKPPFRQGP